MEEAQAIVVNKGDDLVDLPPGFRFHPTDEEIITSYLTEKVVNSTFIASAIGEADLNKCEPWDLPKKAKMGEKEWYFFCQRDRKYPTGMRTNRATESGYWKATGKDKEIYKGKGSLVGMKKTLVFYRGRAPKGEKTNWVMHEYRLEGKFSYNLPKAAKDEWVVCRVFHKSAGIKKAPLVPDLLRMNSFENDFLDSSSLPPLMETPFSNTNRPGYGENEFKGTSSYFSMQQKQQDQKNYHLPTNSYTYQPGLSDPIGNINPNLYPQIPIPNPSFSFHQANPNLNPNPGYLHQNYGYGGTDQQAFLRAFSVDNETSGLERQCKVEQFSSNHSMVSLSQDTGVSNDMNTEISSVVSKHDAGGGSRSYEDLEGPSVSPFEDLGSLWDVDYS